MKDNDSFTSVVNYRKLASHFKELGMREVPSLEDVLAEVQKMKDPGLMEWVLEKTEANGEQFITILEYQMSLLVED
jgi:hypothetical protein